MTVVKAVNVHEAKTHLSRLLERVAQGEEITIAKAGRPVAKLVAVSSSPRRRVLGQASGSVRVSRNFDAPLPKSVRRAFGQR